MSEQFFEVQREQSSVKSRIVSHYFSQWAQIIIGSLSRTEAKYGYPMGKICYMDLFAGPGEYQSGSKSTPLLVLEESSKHENTQARIQIIFNDGDRNHAQSLSRLINEFEGVEQFANRPVVRNVEVDDELVTKLADYNHVPTLLFLDPFGYKGLSLDLINAVLKDWGCDCIFFFNYLRINMGVDNPILDTPVAAVFGESDSVRLREKLGPLAPWEREVMIVEELSQKLKNAGTENNPRFVLPFRFRNETGSRTSHYLIFVSKHFRGYDLMKGIMAKESSELGKGVPSFEFNPATNRQQLLFSLNTSFQDLERMLLDDFAGCTAKFDEIYENHSVDKPFMREHYREVLWDLYDKEIISADPPPKRKNTFAKHIVATFPPLT